MNTVHWRTPSLIVNDGRGLPVRQVVYLRDAVRADAQALITRHHHDVPGRLIEQWDPRLFDSAAKPNLATVYQLSGEAIRVDSVDAGWRLSLTGVGGETQQRWDQRGSHWRITHDDQLRVTAVEENARPNVERYAYAAGSADAGYNLRGQMIEQIDPSGSLGFDSYSLLGLALRETRTFADNTPWTSSRTFSPLGAVLNLTDAGEHRQLLRYDVAGQLTQVQLQLKGATGPQILQRYATYNAMGQIQEQAAGSVISQLTYDPADGRLLSLKAGKSSEASRQNLSYDYDRMGNVLHIEDHTQTTVYYANQRVTGNRAFTYDSLYRLTSADGFEADVPNDQPGLPEPIIPIDSGRRYNYTEHYEYDLGNNLTTLRHVRDNNSFTQTTRIDPGSNRGVRWKEGDPQPVFSDLFDAHGNLLALQRGQPMSWNARDQLSTVTLLTHGNGLPDDEETYLYSQGERVGKRHVTHTASATHSHEVRYLPGLEVRTKSTGEALQVIVLPLAHGQVRCLHWVANPPADIEPDQLRYNLDDHLGSCTLELDRTGALISQEIYYPFGGTAWWAASSQVQADYKTIRYSGKEMDASGLYYYGARYYAPWLQRWVSADPGGDVDGLNLYGFVGNNPLRYMDPEGGAKEESVIILYAGFISALSNLSQRTLGQVHDVINQKHIKRNLLMNFANVVGFGFFGYEAGNEGGGQVGLHISDAPHAVTARTTNRLPFIEAASGGNFMGDIAGAVTDTSVGLGAALEGKTRLLGNRLGNLFENMGRVGPLIPQTSQMSVAAIDSSLGIPEAANGIQPNWKSIREELIHPALNSILNPEFAIGRGLGAWISILPGTLNLFQRAIEADDIQNRLDPVKIAKIEGLFADWETATLQRSAWMESAFDALGSDVVPLGVGPNGARAPITRAGLQQATAATLHNIRQLQGAMAAYREAGTTDNQYRAWKRTPKAVKAVKKGTRI